MAMWNRSWVLDDVPTPERLWQWWSEHLGLTQKQEILVTQIITAMAVAKRRATINCWRLIKPLKRSPRANRILLVMATGTGKTFTAFQIIWRLWKSKAKKRILFLADRNILVDQTMTNDLSPLVQR